MGQTILTIFSSVSWIIAGEEEKQFKNGIRKIVNKFCSQVYS